MNLRKVCKFVAKKQKKRRINLTINSQKKTTAIRSSMLFMLLMHQRSRQIAVRYVFFMRPHWAAFWTNKSPKNQHTSSPTRRSNAFRTNQLNFKTTSQHNIFQLLFMCVNERIVSSFSGAACYLISIETKKNERRLAVTDTLCCEFVVRSHKIG